MGLTAQSVKIDAMKDMFNIVKTDKQHIIALAGNPNTGKSTVFNYLTGLRQHTGNWPGKTVVSARGEYSHNGEEYVLVDLPGSYSLYASSKDEEVARDFVCYGEYDAIVVVADATCLERNLNLVFQISEITDNVILCINLIDEARKKNIVIDKEGLEKELNIPIVLTSARNGTGMNDLKNLVERTTLSKRNSTNGGNTKKTNKTFKFDDDTNVREKASEQNYNYANFLRQKYIIEDAKKLNRDKKIDDIITSKLFGLPIMLLLLGVVFWITIQGANVPSQILANLLFSIEEKFIDLFTRWGVHEILRELLIHGMYRTLAWVVAVMLPPMAIFFPLFSLLEDLGYLPRVAFNLDHLFKKACAHGKQCLTMCMGFGCNAAGVIGCRIIDSPRERVIAVITNNFVPCNGRFPTIIVLSSAFFAVSSNTFINGLIPSIFITLMILFGIVTTLLVSYLLSKTILKGVPSTFTLELPPYRVPKIGHLLYTSIIDRTIFVLSRAVLVAAPAGAVTWLLANIYVGNFSIIAHLANYLNPVATLIGLDGIILMAFIAGLPANEIVLPVLFMAYLSTGSLTDIDSVDYLRQVLLDNGWTALTALNVMLFSLLHWPCSTTLWTIKKETGSIKWTMAAFIIPTAIAFAVCFVTAGIYRIFF